LTCVNQDTAPDGVRWREMKRRVFNILSAVSLVVALAVAALWVRSSWVIDSPQIVSNHSVLNITSVRGRIEIRHYHFLSGIPVGAVSGWYTFSAAQYKDVNIGGWAFLGFVCDWGSFSGVDTIVIVLPSWALMALAIAPPTYWFHRRRKRKRRLSHGLCLSCGYDLRASKDKCPECGEAVPTPSP